MKHFSRRALALLLSAALLSSTALASYALGDELHQYSIRLSEGASLTTQMFWSNSKSDLRTENYITYSPHSSLSPVVSYGDSILVKQSVPSMATSLEKQGERVLGGINGDYFVMATGDPLGIVLTDGILRSSASYLSAVGFFQDGSALIGKPELTVTAKFAGYALKVADVNKIRTSTGGYYLLSEDFGATTQNSQPGVDVVLAPLHDNLGSTVTADNGQAVTLSDQLKIGSRVSCVVEEVLQSTGSVNIPKGKFVMTINKNGSKFLQDTLSSLKPGDSMDIEITSTDPRWNTVDCAIGAMYRILTDGTVNTGLDDTAAPRTAIGVKADGKVIFYTIDGRQSGLSVGASMTQVANRLKELGCVNAVCLDGGGSTTIGTTNPGSNGFSVVNSPSDGATRKVTNALFLVSNLSPSGVPARLYVEPKQRVLLSGATTTCTAAFVDSNWFPMNDTDVLSYTAKRGSITQDGIYTAPSTGGSHEITVTSSSNLMGTATVTVFQTPTAIRLSNESTGAALSSLTVSEKETVNLKAAASHKLISLGATDRNFTWTVSPASLGEITADGVFTSGSVKGTGSIQVSAGGFTATLPLTVTVPTRYQLLDDFEASALSAVTSSESCKLSQNTNADQVRFGTKSLRVDYSLTAGSGGFGAKLAVGSKDSYLSLWVYGDSSGNQLSATVQDSSGAASPLSLGTLNFTGWKNFTAPLPSNTTQITGFGLSGSKASGSIYLDQILSTNQQAPDQSAPSVKLTVSGSSVSAVISDNSGAAFTQNQLRVLLDGKPLSFNFTPTNGSLTATLPTLSPSLHRLTVTATDLSGNVGRASQSLGASTNTSLFGDMKGHWAEGYTDSLQKLGVISGVQQGDEQLFYPNRSITRGDFALMTARWMGLDLSQYASVKLPFADAASIPSWSQNAVKAMYSLGIMKGSQNSNGVYAYATASITRAEAMTILGRIQVKGYPAASLSSFEDAGTVPTWASAYLGSLVAQGVVNGDNGYLRPGDSVSRAEVAKLLFTIW